MTDVERRWLPADWLDELNPGLQGSPDAFIERDGEGWALRLPEGDPDRTNPFYRIVVEPGQVVDFLWMEFYGHRTLTVRDDRSWSLDAPVDERATLFYEPSESMIGASIAELVDDSDPYETLEPGTYRIDTYHWSERIPFRFDVDASGQSRLVQCAGAN